MQITNITGATIPSSSLSLLCEINSIEQNRWSSISKRTKFFTVNTHCNAKCRNTAVRQCQCIPDVVQTVLEYRIPSQDRFGTRCATCPVLSTKIAMFYSWKNVADSMMRNEQITIHSQNHQGRRIATSQDARVISSIISSQSWSDLWLLSPALSSSWQRRTS